MQVYETSEKLNTALFPSCISMWNDRRKNYLFHLPSNSLTKEYFFIIFLIMNYKKKIPLKWHTTTMKGISKCTFSSLRFEFTTNLIYLQNI